MISNCRVLWKLLKLQLWPNRLRKKISLFFPFFPFSLFVFIVRLAIAAAALTHFAYLRINKKKCLIIEVLVVVHPKCLSRCDYTLSSLRQPQDRMGNTRRRAHCTLHILVEFCAFEHKVKLIE